MAVSRSLRHLFGATMAVASRPELEVVYGPVLPTAYLDSGEPGDSAGDVRLFSVEAVTTQGALVSTDWIMTTTGQLPDRPDVSRRVATATFVFGEEPDGEIVMEGAGLYPGKDSTFVTDSQLVRSITGGSGIYSGASGQVLSTHYENGDWSHQFFLEKSLPAVKGKRFDFVIGRLGDQDFRLDVGRSGVVDVVIGFEAKGDRLSVASLPVPQARQIGSGDFFVQARGVKQLSEKLSTDSLFVYEKKYGGLYYNANGEEVGLGRSGGLLAVLDGAPSLGKGHVVVA